MIIIIEKTEPQGETEATGSSADTNIAVYAGLDTDIGIINRPLPYKSTGSLLIEKIPEA